jgi:hypothetical protein
MLLPDPVDSDCLGRSSGVLDAVAGEHLAQFEDFEVADVIASV